MRSILVALMAGAVTIAPASAAPRRRAAPRLPTFCSLGSDVPGVTVPDGFCVRKFADVHTPRVLAFAPNGDLFVSSPLERTPGGAPPGDAAIYVFHQTDPTLPPVRTTFASGSPRFDTVHGLAFTSDSLLYSVRDAVFAVPYATGELSLVSGQHPVVDMSDMNASSRWTHTIAVSTDGSIYVSRGQFDNTACAPPNPRSGSILKAGVDPSGQLVSSGFRDPLYIRCLPWGSCYAVELTGDGFPTELGAAEKLIEVREKDNFGYPCCVGPNIPNPDLAFMIPPVTPDCSGVAAALQTFPLHDTPFGFDWERQKGFWPPPYEGAFFVGLHGGFGTWTNAGLQWAPADRATHLPLGHTQPFLQGVGHSRSIKRVADVVFAPDGRLFFSDDQGEETSDKQGGAIYWIAPKTLVRH